MLLEGVSLNGDNPMKTEGLDEAVAWMKNLDKQIRVFVDKPLGGGPGFWRELRRITQEEWEIVQKYVTEYELSCYLSHTAYGFDFSVYSHGEMAGTNPPSILVIEDGSFPFESSNRGFEGQEESLRILSRLTHSPRNTELLEWYGFEALNEAESYTY